MLHFTKSLITTLRNKRLELNYSQFYMAYQLKISQNSYSKIENCYTKLTLEKFIHICALLGVDAYELLQPAINRQAESPAV